MFPADIADRPFTVTVKDVQKLSGLGPTMIWKLIGDGRLQAVRVDRRTLVTLKSLQKLLTPPGTEERAA
jgi:hypothetical protein